MGTILIVLHTYSLQYRQVLVNLLSTTFACRLVEGNIRLLFFFNCEKAERTMVTHMFLVGVNNGLNEDWVGSCKRIHSVLEG